MNYFSPDAIVKAADGLVFDADRALIRTRGFWHVLIFLRARRLLDSPDQLLLRAFSLTEAAFDLNGISLPSTPDARNVYFEPGASQGFSEDMFRHREGPRQTYLDRIKNGFDGRTHWQPNLFNKSGTTFPINVSLQPNWIEVLRANPQHCVILDERTADLITWIFRFGVPMNNQGSCSIGAHQGQGILSGREDLQLRPVPAEQGELVASLKDFFGLTEESLHKLIPKLGLIAPTPRTADQPVAFDDLQAAMLYHFSSKSAEVSSTLLEESGSPDLLPQKETSGPVEYRILWDELLTQLLANPPLTGVNEVLSQTIAALRAEKFVIFLGAPGTGKTELAKAICDAASDLGAPGFTIATATAEWTTFETIGGYMPAVDGTGRLDFVENAFTESARTGKWLIIDELNRADIDKAFGELFTLFSGAKVRLAYRREDKPIILVPPNESADLSSESPIYVPRDWRLIGTMNTFDKASLFQLSYAFMRRFAFVEIPIPQRDDFAKLLDRAIAATLPVTSVDEAWTSRAAAFIRDIFAPPSGQGLDRINLRVGAAIPLDIVRYLGNRYKMDPSQPDLNSVASLTLEAVEMYLYPQFEGKDREHLGIVNAIAQTLGLNTTQQRSTSRALSTWTGAPPDAWSEDV